MIDQNLMESGELRSWERMAPITFGFGVSTLLFIGVVISGKPDETPTPKPISNFAEAVVLPPPPPLKKEIPTDTPVVPNPVRLDFHRMSSDQSITLLDVTIEPQKDENILEKMDLEMNSFQITMDDVDRLFVYNKSEVDVKPDPLYRPIPDIPKRLRKQIDRKVRVMFYVNTLGRVENPYIIESSHPELNEIVLEELLKWRFRPARKGNRDVNCWSRTVLIFKSQNSSAFQI